MDRRSHWEDVYRTKDPTSASWYCPHLQTSLAWIDWLAENRPAALTPARSSPAILDIGGGASTLAQDLLARGFDDITVLDLSPTALAYAQREMGREADRVRWIAADFLTADLPVQRYDICHDRAVFHFLQHPEERNSYVRQVNQILRPGGHLILATFALQGPQRCSGLEVTRYDAGSIAALFGERFRLQEARADAHRTPQGGIQQFLYGLLRLGPGAGS